MSSLYGESKEYFSFPSPGQIFTHRERGTEYVVTEVTGTAVILNYVVRIVAGFDVALYAARGTLTYNTLEWNEALGKNGSLVPFEDGKIFGYKLNKWWFM